MGNGIPLNIIDFTESFYREQRFDEQYHRVFLSCLPWEKLDAVYITDLTVLFSSEITLSTVSRPCHFMVYVMVRNGTVSSVVLHFMMYVMVRNRTVSSVVLHFMMYVMVRNGTRFPFLISP